MIIYFTLYLKLNYFDSLVTWSPNISKIEVVLYWFTMETQVSLYPHRIHIYNKTFLITCATVQVGRFNVTVISQNSDQKNRKMP